jgi:hypothetical protein
MGPGPGGIHQPAKEREHVLKVVYIDCQARKHAIGNLGCSGCIGGIRTSDSERKGNVWGPGLCTVLGCGHLSVRL